MITPHEVSVRASYFQYGLSNLVSELLIIWHHHFKNKKQVYFVWYIVLMFANLLSSFEASKIKQDETFIKFLDFLCQNNRNWKNG